jgi:hypothetical protein
MAGNLIQVGSGGLVRVKQNADGKWGPVVAGASDPCCCGICVDGVVCVNGFLRIYRKSDNVLVEVRSLCTMSISCANPDENGWVGACSLSSGKWYYTAVISTPACGTAPTPCYHPVGPCPASCGSVSYGIIRVNINTGVVEFSFCYNSIQYWAGVGQSMTTRDDAFCYAVHDLAVVPCNQQLDSECCNPFP